MKYYNYSNPNVLVIYFKEKAQITQKITEYILDLNWRSENAPHLKFMNQITKQKNKFFFFLFLEHHIGAFKASEANTLSELPGHIYKFYTPPPQPKYSCHVISTLISVLNQTKKFFFSFFLLGQRQLAFYEQNLKAWSSF